MRQMAPPRFPWFIALKNHGKKRMGAPGAAELGAAQFARFSRLFIAAEPARAEPGNAFPLRPAIRPSSIRRKYASWPRGENSDGRRHHDGPHERRGVSRQNAPGGFCGVAIRAAVFFCPRMSRNERLWRVN